MTLDDKEQLEAYIIKKFTELEEALEKYIELEEK